MTPTPDTSDLQERPPRADLLVVGASELLTCAADAPDLIGRIQGGSVAIAGERIVAVGSDQEVQAAVDSTGATVIDAGGCVVLPGFVDCHTHVIFGGSRVDEYTARISGDDMRELADRGLPVGIVGTVAATRALSAEELAQAALPRLREMLAAGTTTVESKSGYGLTVESELRILAANPLLAAQQPVEIVSTFLGAHALPPDQPRARYVASVIEEMIPQVAEAGLAEFCDVFCEDGYFSVAETQQVLAAGLAAGLLPKLHLDQYSHTGAAPLAAELGCVSVDHLNYTPPAELARLAEAGVVGVPLPALDFAVDHPQPVDGARLRRAGMEIALATDICPGCWLPSMQLVIALAGRLARLSPAAAIRAATYGAAAALGRSDRIGSLTPGKQADILILDVARHEDVAYKIGRNAVTTVIKRGRVMLERREGPA